MKKQEKIFSRDEIFEAAPLEMKKSILGAELRAILSGKPEKKKYTANEVLELFRRSKAKDSDFSALGKLIYLNGSTIECR